MPAELAVDREAVKAHAITHGLRPAARHFGINENTVLQWSNRDPEGPWVQSSVQIVDNRPESMRPKAVIDVIKPSVAARNAKESNSAKTRHFLGKAVLKGAKAAAKLKGGQILDAAPAIKSLVDSGDKLYQWSASAQSPTLRLELVARSVGQLQAEELPSIDVESEVSRIESEQNTPPPGVE
jgi:hypothetical protein